MSKSSAATFVTVLGLAAAATAQTPAPGVPASRSFVEVTPEGAFVREAQATQTPCLETGSQKLTAPGLMWSHPDGGLAWIAKAVSIGDRGTQVFSEYDLNSEAVELFSVFDSNPPTAVWTDGSPLGTENHTVASADATDTHVAMHQVLVGGVTTRQAVVRKYSSGSATPDWSYTFAPVINAGSKVGISRDGQTIVAALMNNNTWDVEIAVFGPGSGTPVSYTAVPVGASNYLRGFDLSADGTTLYFSAGVTAYVFDIATQTVVFNTNIGASFDSHAISGDGSVFAFGNFNVMRVWERSGATYVNTFNVNRGGGIYCAEIDISDDSSTVAFGWYLYSPGLTVILEAYDIPTQSQLMEETVTGTGTYQNVVADVSCSADGSRFAVGLWGDQGGVADEVRIYNRGSSTPVVTLNTPGSVFDVDLSADGQRVVAGTKAVHANTFGNGGSIELVDAGGEDLELRGTPSAGALVTIRLHGEPSKSAVLLESLAEASPPVTYPGGIGTLYIQRKTMTAFFMGPIPSSGVAFINMTLPVTVGTSRYYQGLTIGPRRLTKDWLKVTVLP